MIIRPERRQWRGPERRRRFLRRRAQAPGGTDSNELGPGPGPTTLRRMSWSPRGDSSGCSDGRSEGFVPGGGSEALDLRRPRLNTAVLAAGSLAGFAADMCTDGAEWMLEEWTCRALGCAGARVRRSRVRARMCVRARACVSARVCARVHQLLLLHMRCVSEQLLVLGERVEQILRSACVGGWVRE
jgi:hypothetical protein